MDTKLEEEECPTRGSPKKSQWISVTGRIRRNEQDLFNTQLKRLQCETLNELVKDVIAGKVARITEDKQIEIMKTQAQTSGILTAQSGYYDFYKRVNDEDFHKWLLDNYHPHTANCFHSYYLKYVDIFFAPKPDVELLKFAPHKRSWILQSIKRFGDFILTGMARKMSSNLS
jgi:hypothetical protein